MYEVSKGLSSQIITELFEQKKEQNNLRDNPQFSVPALNSVYHLPESVLFLVRKTWNILPDSLKKIV